MGQQDPPQHHAAHPDGPPRSLHARCIYNASELLPLRLEVAVPPTAAPMAQPGPLRLQLRIATGEQPCPDPRLPPCPPAMGRSPLSVVRFRR